MDRKDRGYFQKNFLALHRKLTALHTSVNALAAQRAGGCGSCGGTAPLLSIQEPSPAPVEEPSSFSLFADLGVFAVPEGYVHDSYFASFRERHGSEFVHLFGPGTDLYLTKNATRILCPGNRLRVRIFEQYCEGTTSAEERLSFLGTQSAVLLGTCGLMLTWSMMSEQLPLGRWIASFEGPPTCITLGMLRVDKEAEAFKRYCIQTSRRDLFAKEHLMLCFTDA